MQDSNTLLGLIRREITSFTQNQIEVVPGYYFNQYDTIKRIHLYTNGQFENQVPYHGKQRIFSQQSTFRRDSAAKSIDIDTKDMRLIADNPESEFTTFLAEKEFKLWLKTDKFGKTLNSFGEDLPTYGSIVSKCQGTNVENVDLRRLFLDPTVENIQDSRFVTHELYMTENELRKMKGKWNNVEEVIQKFGSYYAPQSYENAGSVNVQGATSYYKIYERYGDVPEWMTDNGDSNDMKRRLIIVAEPQAASVNIDTGQTKDEGLVLVNVPWDKEFPFKDCHYEKTKGRWLGIGVVEKLFAVQERLNELANQKRISMEQSAFHLYNTADRKVARNLAKTQENGNVLVSDSPITAIATEERNLAAFNSEEQIWTKLADQITFSYDASRGEAVSASTPATNAVIQNNNVNSFFQKKRENFGLFITELVNDHVLPQVVRDISNDHILRFMGEPEDLARFDERIMPFFIKKQVIDEIMGGRMVDDVRLGEIKGEVQNQLRRMGSQRFAEIKKDMYRNSKFMFDLVVTDEQQDSAVMAQNTFKFISDLAANPAIIDDPVLKTFYAKYASQIGISPMELEMAIQKRQEMQATQPQQPVPGQNQQLNAPQGQPQEVPTTTPLMNNQALQPVNA